MNKAITIIIILVVIIGGYMLINKKTEAPVVAPQPEAGQPMAETPSPTPSPSPTPTPSVKEFTVTGSNFKFAPLTLSVKKGDTVKINFVNSGGMHDFVIDEFNARTKQIEGGASETVTFVADKAGTFEYYCSVGTHRQMGMKGTLTVTE